MAAIFWQGHYPPAVNKSKRRTTKSLLDSAACRLFACGLARFDSLFSRAGLGHLENGWIVETTRVEEPVFPVRQSSSGGGHKQSTLSQNTLSPHEKVGCKNWHNPASANSAAGGGYNQQTLLEGRYQANGLFYPNHTFRGSRHVIQMKTASALNIVT